MTMKWTPSVERVQFFTCFGAKESTKEKIKQTMHHWENKNSV